MEPPIPVEIATIERQASEASERGERVTAIWLQEQVMDWVNTHLPRIHPYRAECLTVLNKPMKRCEYYVNYQVMIRNMIPIFPWFFRN